MCPIDPNLAETDFKLTSLAQITVVAYCDLKRSSSPSDLNVSNPHLSKSQIVDETALKFNSVIDCGVKEWNLCDGLSVLRR